MRSRILQTMDEALTRKVGRRTVVGGIVAGVAATSATSVGSIAQEASPAASPVASLGAPGELTIYSGRSEDLILPVLETAESATEVSAEIRFGSTGELAIALLEEGENSPASLFIAQDAGALGQLANEGLLATLPSELLDRVDARFRSPDGLWVGLSARARVLVYNTDMLSEADLPASMLDLVDERWAGQIGWAPENASFQSHVTAFREVLGEDEARAWLEGIIANEPVMFDGNAPVVQAVAAGEISVGLVNHYYKFQIEKEEGPLPVENHFFPDGDIGSLINVAGLAILADCPNPDQALAVADYLLQAEAQEYFASETSEYPLSAGVQPSVELPALDSIQTPDIDLSDLADLKGTVELLTDLGLI